MSEQTAATREAIRAALAEALRVRFVSVTTWRNRATYDLTISMQTGLPDRAVEATAEMLTQYVMRAAGSAVLAEKIAELSL